MELSWSTKLKITITVTLGAIAIGILAWPLIVPADPITAVRASNLGPLGIVALLGLAFAAGFVCYFVSWPYGREIAILAAPSGLAIWAIRTGNLATLIQLHPTLPQRQAIIAGLRWESLFWLLVVAAGFAGVLVAQKLKPSSRPILQPTKHNTNFNRYIAPVLALAISAVIVQVFLRIIACDLPTAHNQAAAQPPTGQIVFAVWVSFGLAAFAAERFLRTSYVWCILSSAIVSVISTATYLDEKTLKHFLSSFPANFFPDAVVSILPIQMVAFGTLGAIWGYWLAFRYEYWRRYESN